MKKAEIIDTTLAAMHGKGGLLHNGPDTEQEGGSDDYEAAVVIPTLNERLPDDIDIRVCSDFPHLQAATCCDTCHSFFCARRHVSGNSFRRQQGLDLLFHSPRVAR
jgi:hypothetical protein